MFCEAVTQIELFSEVFYNIGKLLYILVMFCFSNKLSTQYLSHWSVCFPFERYQIRDVVLQNIAAKRINIDRLP